MSQYEIILPFTQANMRTYIDGLPWKLQQNELLNNCDREVCWNFWDHSELPPSCRIRLRLMKQVSWMWYHLEKWRLIHVWKCSPVEQSIRNAQCKTRSPNLLSKVTTNWMRPETEHTLPTREATNNSDGHISDHIICHFNINDNIHYRIRWHKYITADDTARLLKI